jgi:hypothetical protein
MSFHLYLFCRSIIFFREQITDYLHTHMLIEKLISSAYTNNSFRPCNFSIVCYMFQVIYEYYTDRNRNAAFRCWLFQLVYHKTNKHHRCWNAVNNTLEPFTVVYIKRGMRNELLIQNICTTPACDQMMLHLIVILFRLH